MKPSTKKYKIYEWGCLVLFDEVSQFTGSVYSTSRLK
jgi:hypothetical protein